MGIDPLRQRDGRPRVLYLVYWGAAEPLGQSIVLPQVKRLSELGARVTLVTFDKAGDLARCLDMRRIREDLEGRGVRWISLRYHRRPQIAAKMFDALMAWTRGAASQLGERADIIHARTFVGGIMGVMLASLVRTRLVYHNEGFYPDEQVDGGVWVKGSFNHRLAKFIERLLYSRAHGIVVLSERAKAEVERLPAVQRRATQVVVVPSCVDPALFPLVSRPRRNPERTLHLVYVGSIGNRYLFDRVVEFAAFAYRRLGRVKLRVLTRTAPDTVHQFFRRSGLPSGVASVGYVPHAQIAKELAQQDAGLFLFTRGLSEHGCSPTKIGEYWASGLPVIVTPNISDTEQIVREERVGVLLPEFSAEAYNHALDELLTLFQDPDLGKRCRLAAERHYALGPACERLYTLYQALVKPRRQSLEPAAAPTQRAVAVQRKQKL